jgi:hypothetical protein
MRGTHCPVVVVVVIVVVVVYLCADICILLSSALEQQTFLQIKENHVSLYCVLFLYCNIHMKSATMMVLIKQKVFVFLNKNENHQQKKPVIA